MPFVRLPTTPYLHARHFAFFFGGLVILAGGLTLRLQPTTISANVIREVPHGSTLLISLPSLPMASLIGAALILTLLAWQLARVSAKRTRAEIALRESEKRYRHVVERSPDAVVIHDGMHVLFANAAAARITRALNPEHLIGRSVADFIPPEDRKQLTHTIQEALTNGIETIPHEERIVCLDGSIITVEVASSTLQFDGRPALQLVARDITERKEMEEKLRTLAHYDALTKLPNRAYFFEQLQATIARARRSGEPFALFFLDLDKFKAVNDTYGHEVGDDLLRAAASRLRDCVRESDIVCRMGGDEFTIILPATADAHAARVIADKINAVLRVPFYLRGTVCDIGTSIGVSYFPVDGSDAATLVQIADRAMYASKALNRNEPHI